MWRLTNAQKLGVWALFAHCFLLVGWRTLNVSMYDDNKARDAIHGDAYSDINTHSAAKFFLDYGFAHTYGLPVHGYEHGEPPPGTESATSGVYTHYPALPDILAGFAATVFQSADERGLRLVPILLSVVWFFLIFNFLLNILPDKRAALLSASLVVLSHYFIFFADTIHKHAYEEFLKWVFVAGLLRYYQPGKRNLWMLLGLGIIYILAANASFEPITYLAVVVVGLAWVHDKRIFTLETIVLGAAAVSGLGLHLLQNHAWLGSWAAVWADLGHAATLRTGGNTDIQNEMAGALQLRDYLLIPIHWLNRAERGFLIPGWAMLPLGWFALRKLRREAPQLVPVFWVLLAATLSWSLAMTQHFTVHLFTVRHAGLLFGLIAGYGLVEWWTQARRDWRQGKWQWKGFHVVLGLYMTGMALSQQVLDWFRYGYLYGVIYP